MNFKDVIKIYVETQVSDNSGGFITEKVLVQTIKGRIIPYKVEMEMYANGKVNTNMAKLLTKDKISVGEYDDYYVEFKGQMYIKVQFCDYDKVKYILLEKVK